MEVARRVDRRPGKAPTVQVTEEFCSVRSWQRSIGAFLTYVTTAWLDLLVTSEHRKALDDPELFATYIELAAGPAT